MIKGAVPLGVTGVRPSEMGVFSRELQIRKPSTPDSSATQFLPQTPQMPMELPRIPFAEAYLAELQELDRRRQLELSRTRAASLKPLGGGEILAEVTTTKNSMFGYSNTRI